MKTIFVGDPHIQPSNIQEGESIVGLIKKTQKEFDASILVISGDLFHTHAVLRLEVVNFWQKAIAEMSSIFPKVILLVGNHDMIGDRQREGQISALDTLKLGIDNVKIIDKPEMYSNWGFMPYFSNNDKFVNEANKLVALGATTIFCHQTFDGSQFENGFYAPEGVDQKLIGAQNIVSGHIHKTQTLGKVFYPGTPKWDSLSDANESKGIWTFDGSAWLMVDSSSVVEPIRNLEVTPDTDLSGLPTGAKTIYELIGPSTWIGQTSKKLKGKGRVVARPTDSSERKLKENKKQTIFEFLDKDTKTTDKTGVRKYIENLMVSI